MGRPLLYFTDNMVSYDIFRKGTSKSLRLWQLLLDIKVLELSLECIVQVIHVPGTIMISQGTDGLSRGVTMQRLASHQSNSLIPLMWRAAPVSPPLLSWTLSVLPPLWSPSTQWLSKLISQTGAGMLYWDSVFFGLCPLVFPVRPSFKPCPSGLRLQPLVAIFS